MKYFGKYLGYRLRKSFTYFALITVLASLFAIFIDIYYQTLKVKYFSVKFYFH